MRLYQIDQQTLLPARAQDFALEKEMHTLAEANLTELWGLEWVATELTLKQFRMDTLAFDPVSRSFVVIEYKRGSNVSVVDQGMTYLNLSLNHKADLVLAYNERTNGERANAQPLPYLRKDDVDWSQTRVMIVAPAFTKFQREALALKNLPIELWELRRFGGTHLVVQQLHSEEGAASFDELAVNVSGETDAAMALIQKEIKVYSEADLVSKGSEETQEAYEHLKNAILGMDASLTVKTTKLYVSFVSRRNVVDVCIQKNALKLWLNIPKGELEDPKQLARDVSDVGHWGNGDYEVMLYGSGYVVHFEYVLSLIRQVLERMK